MLLRSLRHPPEGKSAEESAQFFFGRRFKLPIPRFKIFFRDTEDRFCSDHLISFFQSFPEEFERAVHKMDFEIGSDFRRLSPEILPFDFCPAAEIKNDITAQQQNASRGFPHDCFDFGVTDIMQVIVSIVFEIVSEETQMPFVGSETECGKSLFKASGFRSFPAAGKPDHQVKCCHFRGGGRCVAEKRPGDEIMPSPGSVFSERKDYSFSPKYF